MTFEVHPKFPRGQVIKVGQATENDVAHRFIISEDVGVADEVEHVLTEANAPVVESVIESKVTFFEAVDGLKWAFGEFYRNGKMRDFKMWRR